MLLFFLLPRQVWNVSLSSHKWHLAFPTVCVYWKRLAGLARLFCVGPDLGWLLPAGLRAWHLSLAASELTRKALLFSVFTHMCGSWFLNTDNHWRCFQSGSFPEKPSPLFPVVLSCCFQFLGGRFWICLRLRGLHQWFSLSTPCPLLCVLTYPLLTTTRLSQKKQIGGGRLHRRFRADKKSPLPWS